MWLDHVYGYAGMEITSTNLFYTHNTGKPLSDLAKQAYAGKHKGAAPAGDAGKVSEGVSGFRGLDQGNHRVAHACMHVWASGCCASAAACTRMPAHHVWKAAWSCDIVVAQCKLSWQLSGSVSASARWSCSMQNAA